MAQLYTLNYYSNIFFEGNSSPVFSNNIAGWDAGNGGAIYSYNSSVIMFKGNSFSMFSNNSANYGAAIYSEYYSNISFEENSSPVFSNNVALNIIAIYLLKKILLQCLVTILLIMVELSTLIMAAT